MLLYSIHALMDNHRTVLRLSYDPLGAFAFAATAYSALDLNTLTIISDVVFSLCRPTHVSGFTIFHLKKWQERLSSLALISIENDLKRDMTFEDIIHKELQVNMM